MIQLQNFWYCKTVLKSHPLFHILVNHLYFIISLVFKKSCPLLFQPKKEAREGALDFKLNIYHDQPKWNFKKWKAVENFEVAKIANQIDFINKWCKLSNICCNFKSCAPYLKTLHRRNLLFGSQIATYLTIIYLSIHPTKQQNEKWLPILPRSINLCLSLFLSVYQTMLLSI